MWFVAAFISRPIQGLSVTTLELTTISFIIVFFATSYCWMHKPSEVFRPVILHCETSIAQIRSEVRYLPPTNHYTLPNTATRPATMTPKPTNARPSISSTPPPMSSASSGATMFTSSTASASP